MNLNNFFFKSELEKTGNDTKIRSQIIKKIFVLSKSGHNELSTKFKLSHFSFFSRNLNIYVFQAFFLQSYFKFSTKEHNEDV